MEPLKNYNRIVDGPLSPEAQALAYYDVLSRGGAGAVFHCYKGEERLNDQGKPYNPMVPYCVRKKESFVEQYIQGREHDSYITVNLFSGKYRYNEGTHKWGWFRQEQDCVAINGFLVDFDIMKGKEVHYTLEEGDRIVKEVLFKVDRLVEEGAMVKPTLVTLSGRGIQMLFLYEEAIGTYNKEALYKHNKLYTHVVTFLQSIFDKNFVEVDTKVTDAPRICRLPGTMHTKNGRMATLQEINGDCYYNVDDLCKFFAVDLAEEAPKKPGRKAKASKVVSITKQVKKCKNYQHILNKNKPVISRNEVIMFENKLIERRNIQGKIKSIEKLAEYRGMSKGQGREVMLHIYYSLQRQINKATIAEEKTRRFNSYFDEPLPEGEVYGLIKNANTHRGGKTEKIEWEDGKAITVEHQYPNGYYEASRQGIIEMLGMSEEEIVVSGITQRQMEKERAQRNNAAKKEHLERLIEMLKNGKKDFEIAKEYMEFSGKSRASAYRWIAKAKETIENVERQVREGQEAAVPEIEKALSHFGVNAKSNMNIYEAKGPVLLEREERKESESGTVGIERVESDGTRRYTYRRNEFKTSDKLIVDEIYSIELENCEENESYKLIKTTRKMYALDGELLKATEGPWKLCGISAYPMGYKVG